MKSPMTEKAISLLINKLNEIDINVEVQVKLLETAIMNGQKSVYPEKNQFNQKYDPFLEGMKRGKI